MAAITIWVPSICSSIHALGKELVGVKAGQPPPSLLVLCQPPREQIGSLEPGSTALWKGNETQ